MSAEPEIKHFKLDLETHSSIIMASDGIFDVLSNRDVSNIMWTTLKAEDKEGHSLSAN